jgi:VRR-NUC domain-containing protein
MAVPRKLWDLITPEGQALLLAQGVKPQVDLDQDPAKIRRGLLLREKHEQDKFRAWLRMHEVYEITPRSDKRSTIKKGHPDHSLFHFQARVQFIEMKAPSGILSADQLERIAELKARGHDVQICYSAEDAIRAARKYL